MEKHKIVGMIIGILAFVALVAGLTYAWFTWQSTNNTNVSFTVGGVDVTFDAGSDITSSKLRPVSSKEVGVTKGYAIEKVITASSTMTSYLNLYLTLENLPDGLKEESFVWEIYKGNNLITKGNFKNNNQNDKLTIASNQKITSITTTFKLYIWIDGNQANPDTMQNQTFKFVLNADSSDQPPADITLNELGLSANDGTPDFNQVATTDEGMYTAEDDLGPSYYFRGAVENNYVKFANYYWRIIRINGDGTIRMIYDRTSAHANGESSTDRQVSTIAFNSSYNDNAYVGYMYGTPSSNTYAATHANINDSTIKTANDNWYKTNIADRGYNKYVADAIYCNDRSVSTGTGIGTVITDYMLRNRIIQNKKPSFKCVQTSDRFAVSTILGNGDLTYPVGLISADELVFAGARDGSTNNKFYLYSGNNYWQLTPTSFFAGCTRVSYISSEGYFSSQCVSNYFGLRPVISLKPDISFSGNGTMSSPFEIVV